MRPHRPPRVVALVAGILMVALVLGGGSVVGAVMMTVATLNQGSANALFQVGALAVLAVFSFATLRHYILIARWLFSRETLRVEGGKLHRSYPKRSTPDPVPIRSATGWQVDATRVRDKSPVAFAGQVFDTPDVGFGGSVMFAFRGRWHHIGPQLTEAEAEDLLAALTQPSGGAPVQLQPVRETPE